MKEPPISYTAENPHSIQSMFDSIATSYDKMNWLMSFGLHMIWNRRLVHKLIHEIPPNRLNDLDPIQFLDLCCGTGDVLFRMGETFGNEYKNKDIYLHGVDFSTHMLAKAEERKQKKQKKSIYTFSQQDATALLFPESLFDQVAIAYGVRNIGNRPLLFQGLAKILRPEGTLMILELTRPDSYMIQKGHSFYLKYGIPILSRFFSSNAVSYSYLSQSIQNFIPPSTLIQEIEESGFKMASVDKMLFGVATLFVAKRI